MRIFATSATLDFTQMLIKSAKNSISSSARLISQMPMFVQNALLLATPLSLAGVTHQPT
jgi:hypothetical protein